MGIAKVLAPIILLVLWKNVCCDYFTSVDELRELIAAEVYLVDTLEKYIAHVESTHQQVEKFLNEVEPKVKEAKNHDDYYDSPITSYQIIKEVVIDWKNLQNFIFSDQEGEGFRTNFTDLVAKHGFVYPTMEDLSGASKAFARLQETYNLDTSDLAEGIIKGLEFSSPLSSSDCFWLGYSLHQTKDYIFAVEWLMSARVTLNLETQNATSIPDFSFVAEWQILEHLASAYAMLNNSKVSLSLTEEVLRLNPGLDRATQNLALFSDRAVIERRALEKPVYEKKKSQVQTLYEQTCSGELKQSPRNQRKLRCRYVNNNVPFCRLAPLKEEELNLNPLVRYFHEIIYESEIESILNATEDRLVRSMVGGNSNNTGFSENRISKQSWLYLHEHNFLAKLSQRLKDATGLTLDTAEALQVANYGIGGHYGPHFDFFDSSSTSDITGAGNRILTALFYINEVELGGATAFPFLHLAAPPVKRSMVLWHNLHDSLQPDYRTKHAGCPVIVGSKWILNEWFHSGGQEFSRPCGLQATGDISLRYAKIE